MPAAGSSDWLSESTRPWNRVGAYRWSKRAGGHVEERGVDPPQEHADERDDLRLGAEVQRGRRTRTRSSRSRRTAGLAIRSPTTASDSPVSTSPMPNTVWSSAKVASVRAEHVAHVQRLEHAEHGPQRVDAAGHRQRPPQALGPSREREPVAQLAPRRPDVRVGIARHRLEPDPQRDQRADEEGRGVGDERAFEAPPRVHERGRDRADDDREVLRAAEQRVGRHQLRVGHDPGWDGVERRRSPSPRSDRAAAPGR